MRQKNILAFLMVALLLAGTATAYNGKQLAREAVDIGPLTDQNGEQYLFNTDAEGVVVHITEHPDDEELVRRGIKDAEDGHEIRLYLRRMPSGIWLRMDKYGEPPAAAQLAQNTKTDIQVEVK